MGGLEAIVYLSLNIFSPCVFASFQIEPDFRLFSNVNSKRCKLYFSNLSSCTFLVPCCSSFVFDVKPGLQLEPCDLADDPTRARQLEVINQKSQLELRNWDIKEFS